MRNEASLKADAGDKPALGGQSTEGLVQRVAVLLVLLALGVALVLPLWQVGLQSLTGPDGALAGLANYAGYLKTPGLKASLTNSFVVGISTAVISTGLGFVLAYGLTRACVPGKGALRLLLMLPLFAPTLLHGIALVYLFGNKGLMTTGFFGLTQKLFGVAGVDIHLYGRLGIILAETLYTLPQTMMLIATALGASDARLREAALCLGAGPWKIFWKVTLPGARYGLFGALMVSFTLAFTDFGAAKVVGGDTSVLATEIYKQVVGLHNLAMGATVSMVLLLPTVLVFFLDQWVQRRQAAVMDARAVPYTPAPRRWRDWPLTAACWGLALVVLGVMLTAVAAALAKAWPYDLGLTFRHFAFEGTTGGGRLAWLNSVKMALWTALWGTAFTFLAAYFLEKTKPWPVVRRAAYGLGMVPLALPGLVIGLAYVLFFNQENFPLWPGVTLPNPFSSLYGSMTILVVCNVVHFFTVALLTCTTALKQQDKFIEDAASAMGLPFWATLGRVTTPLCLPALLEVALFYFVNAMATVSAVIFLYTPDLPLASVAVVNMDDAGDTAPAAAMCLLVVATSVAARLLVGLAARGLKHRTAAWRGG